MRRFRWALLTTLFLLVACTISLKPYTTNQGDADDDTPTPKHYIACSPYVPPENEPMPALPTFSYRERANDTLFKRKLAAYTAALEAYIVREHKRELQAFRRYRHECHLD